MTDTLTVWALKIQPNSAEEATTPYEFCKNQSPPIIGTGWGLSERYDSVEAALERHRSEENTDQHGNVRFPIRAMLREVSVGDYVWVNEGSEYALCQVKSDWKQHPVTEREADEWTRNDIHNYRIADWEVIEPALVPGYVKRYFSAPRIPTMARPSGGKSDSAKRYVRELFRNEPSEVTDIVDLSEVSAIVEASAVSEVFDLLDPVETEDLVLDYLQSDGWHIVKSSTSRAQPGIECVLRRVKDHKPQFGYVQVKSGDATVDVDEYRELASTAIVYLHQYEAPSGDLPEDIRWIPPVKLRDYIVQHPGYLPSHTAFKLKLGLEAE
jgi:hypothetical protein